MPTFGQHESAQRLFLSGVGAIYALKSDEKKVLKVLQPRVGIWSDDRIQEEIDAFRLRAKIQKSLCKASEYWAPLHEVAALRAAPGGRIGEEPDESSAEDSSAAYGADLASSGAYAVLDRYERSLEALIDGKVNVTNDDLRHLMTGVIHGLLDIRKHARRPHGALKPSNILLANSAILPGATVHLTDPAADGSITAATDAKDLDDLGRILYELVLLRAYDGGTIGRSRDWDRLGPNGEDWRKLCVALLDPHAPAEERDLEKILPRIDTWRAKPKQNKTPMILAAALVFLIAGGLTAYFVLRPKPVPFDPARWERLTLTYDSWFGDFAEQMSKPANRDRFRRAKYPSEVARLFDERAKDLEKFNPETIAGDLGRNWTDRISKPTDAVIKGDARSQVDALAFIDGVTAAFTPEKWPVLRSLDDTARRYDELGWKKPAGEIRGIIEAARPPAIPDTPPDILERIKLVEDQKAGRKETIYQSIERTIAAANNVAEIDARWTRIQDKLKKLPGAQVKLVEKLPAYAAELPRSKEDVASLASAFNEVESLIDKLQAALAPQGREVDYAQLGTDPRAADAVAPSLEAYAALAEAVPQYFKVTDDPRVKVNADWKSRSAAVASDMDDFLKPAAAARVQGIEGQLKDLADRRDALEKALAQGATIPAIEKNRDLLARSAADTAGALEKLFQDAETWSAPFKTDPVEYVKEKREYVNKSVLAKATPEVYAQWKTFHTRLLDKVEAAKENLRKDYPYKLSVDDKFKKLEEIYKEIDAAIPAKVAGLSDITGNDWRQVIAARVAVAYRRDTLVEIMTQLARNVVDDVPDVSNAAYVSARRTALGQFEKNRTDALALIADYSTILDRLDHLDLQANEPAAGAATWRDLSAKWTPAASALLSDQAIVAALKPIADRLAPLVALDGISDYKQLLEQAQSAVPEVALTAWRRIGAAAVSEDLPVLDDEENTQAGLAQKFAALKTLDDARRQRLAGEMAAQLPVRWHRWSDGLKSSARIETALDKAAAFKVTLTAQSDPAMYFNKTFFALRQEYARDRTEARLKPLAQKFIDDVNAMPAEIRQNPAIVDLLARMAKSLSPNQGESSANGAGPMLAKWEQDASREGFRSFYFPSKAAPRFSLDFVRLQVNEAGSGAGQKTVYLSTTEMSTGLFIQVMNTTGKLAEVDNSRTTAAHWFKVPATAADDTYSGPRAWRITSGKFELNEKWLDESEPLMQGELWYPQNATPSPPSNDLPLQSISPWSAMYVAQLLGCRLPTSDEWLAAYDAFEKPAAGASLPRDSWNLRGEAPAGRASWKSQQDYAASKETKGLPYPDKAIFTVTGKAVATGNAAKPWTAADLVKLAPDRFTASGGVYQNSTLWFLPVQKENLPAGAAAPVMHHLVGNVGEMVFDGDKATAVIQSATPVTTAIDEAVRAFGRTKLYVIGGSSLSPPELPFNEKQTLIAESVGGRKGYCDVGFRLAYTAPIDSIVDVLANAFKDPKYLPGPKAKS